MKKLRINLTAQIFLGLVLGAIFGYFLPDIGSQLKPLGLSTIFLCPILGIIGLIFSLKRKSILFSILNLVLILSFPITMFLGNLLFE